MSMQQWLTQQAITARVLLELLSVKQREEGVASAPPT
jgi:hypothetical protein